MNLYRKKRSTFFLCSLLALTCFAGCGKQDAIIDSSDSSAFSDVTDDTENIKDTESPESTEVPSIPEVPEPFTITEKHITVPSLTENYTFLYLSDTHMIKLDGTESEQVTENALPRTDLFKDSEGIPSYERFPMWIDYANAYAVDMFLFGGDMIDFPSEPNLSLLRENIEKLKMPYVYTLGNHDWTYPWDYMTAEGRETYRPLFHDFTNNNPAASITEYKELVILSVDNSSNQIDPEALAITDEALSLGKPVIVIAHVPFSTESLLEKATGVWNSPVSIGMADKGGIFPDANTLAFQEKILAPDSPVICVLSGHVHFYDESNLNDSVIQIIGGAGYNGEGVLLHIGS